MGLLGLSQDMNKAIELWNQAVELGSINAHYNIAMGYYYGGGVEEDKKKAIHHFKLAAMGGHEVARVHLGFIEEQSDNIDRAMKHFMIAARAGFDKSLKMVGEGYKNGHVSKEDYAATLRAYQVSADEMKSEQRTMAAAVERLKKDRHI